jgi:Putative prokaryotic signal transducing protein
MANSSFGPESSFAEHYAAMSEQELLKFAPSYDTLIDPAQSALRAEFSKRNLEPPLIDDSADELNSRNLVTIRRYRDLSEAIVARGVIESAGIFCFLKDENLVRLDWQVSNFIGGIRLQVDANDVEAATDLLNQPIPESIAFDGSVDYEQPHCPRCGSTDIAFQGSDRRAAIAALFTVAVPLPTGAKTWLCNNCDCRWTDDEDAATSSETA